LEGLDYQGNIIPEHRHPNFPLQAAEIKLAELDRLFNRTQMRVELQTEQEKINKKQIIKKFEALYDNVLERDEELSVIPS